MNNLHTAHEIAKYFIALTEEDTGDSITNLKLQKLTYYAQGFNLALYDEPLFNEPIEAWMHGPVVPNLYYSYKKHGSNPIPKPIGMDFDRYNERTKELLNQVQEVYGQFSAWKLRDLTHEEAPWINSYQKPDCTIKHEDMKEFFKTLINT